MSGCWRSPRTPCSTARRPRAARRSPPLSLRVWMMWLPCGPAPWLARWPSVGVAGVEALHGADGVYALDTARATNGSINIVAEQRIVEGMKLLARTEGVFTETAGGVVVSALEELVSRGAIAPGDETVILITGIGLKTLEALGRPQPTHRIYPAVEEVEAIFNEPAFAEIPERVEA